MMMKRYVLFFLLGSFLGILAGMEISEWFPEKKADGTVVLYRLKRAAPRGGIK